MKTQGDPVVIEHVLQLLDRFDDEFLSLASALRNLRKNSPPDFSAVLAEGRLGRRKAYYLLEIAEAFWDLLHSERARLSAIGWTKLKTIARNVTAKNREKLLRLAEVHTAEELKWILRGEEPVQGKKAVLLYFSPKQYEKFAKSISKHGAVKVGRRFAGKEEALIRALRKK